MRHDELFVPLSMSEFLYPTTLPARGLSWRGRLPGALLGTAGIELHKRVFTLWAQRSAGLALLPRFVVSVVLLLVWLGLFA